MEKSNFIRSKGYIDTIEQFDAEFFKLSEKEALYLDPQQRVLFECVLEGIEDSGIIPGDSSLSIGTFVGCNTSQYFLQNLLPLLDDPNTTDLEEMYILTGNSSDYLASKLAYFFNFQGPCQTLNSACSTSLSCVYQACQSLLNYQCDAAVAGGVSITLPKKNGYKYTPESIYSPDGTCKPFDHNSKGTVFSDGAGVVILKRLEDAINDNDQIYSVIKACTSNNDGAEKMGFFAPGVKGQTRAILDALELAEISPELIQFIECHGTATNLGDPIEIRALTDAFSAYTNKKQFCYVSSIKSIMGHMNTAAGVAGLIKAALCVKHKELTPNLYFEKANPNIDFENSPFVPPRISRVEFLDVEKIYAAVSSFGIGGTNVHAIISSAPAKKVQPEERQSNVLVFSAKTEAALTTMIQNHIIFIETFEHSLSDYAYTMQIGRKTYIYKTSFIFKNREDLLKKMRSNIQASSQPPLKELTIRVSNSIENSGELLSLLSKSDFWIKEELSAIEKLIQTDQNYTQHETNFLLLVTVSRLIKNLSKTPIKFVTDNFDPLIALVIAEGVGITEGFACLSNPELYETTFIRELEYPCFSTPLNREFKIGEKLSTLLKEETEQQSEEDRNYLDLSKFLQQPKCSDLSLEIANQLWLMGGAIQWDILYDQLPNKISAPNYPFERKRFWIDRLEKKADTAVVERPHNNFQPSDNLYTNILLALIHRHMGCMVDDLNTSFFELGFDSLSSISFVDDLKKLLNIEISLEVLYQHQNPKLLSNFLEQQISSRSCSPSSSK